jgi:hypothetical protein
VAKHALVFVEEAPPQPKAEPAPSDSTVVLPPEQQAEASVAASSKIGFLRVLKGLAGKSEYELSGISTYIGKSDRVQVPIKGTGIFGSAPEVAASVHRRGDGYVLLAVEDGYPAVNGRAVSGSVPLKDGDFIECGGTTMQFVLKDAAGA